MIGAKVLTMKKTTRRDVLGAIGLAAGVSILPGCAGEARSQATAEDAIADWQYVPLDPAAAGAEAYRLTPEGGCMYGAFRAILAAWLAKNRRSPDAFPFHMMRYGEGGVGGWGAICGALNAGAAVIGLFEPDKKQRERLIGELFSWYERAELPIHQPADAKSSRIAKSVAGSVLCHISVAHWCKASGATVLSNELKQRCCRLTADVASKTVELLNRRRDKTSEPAQPAVTPSSEPPKTIGKMRCAACHKE